MTSVRAQLLVPGTRWRHGNLVLRSKRCTRHIVASAAIHLAPSESKGTRSYRDREQKALAKFSHRTRQAWNLGPVRRALARDGTGPCTRVTPAARTATAALMPTVLPPWHLLQGVGRRRVGRHLQPGLQKVNGRGGARRVLDVAVGVGDQLPVQWDKPIRAIHAAVSPCHKPCMGPRPWKAF